MRCSVVFSVVVLTISFLADNPEAAPPELVCENKCDYWEENSDVHAKPFPCNCRIVRTVDETEAKEDVQNEKATKTKRSADDSDEEKRPLFPFLSKSKLFNLKSRSYEPPNFLNNEGGNEFLEKLREKIEDLKTARESNGLLPSFTPANLFEENPLQGYFDKYTPSFDKDDIVDNLRNHVDSWKEKWENLQLPNLMQRSNDSPKNLLEKLTQLSPRFLGAANPNSESGSNEDEEDEGDSIKKEEEANKGVAKNGIKGKKREDFDVDQVAEESQISERVQEFGNRMADSEEVEDLENRMAGGEEGEDVEHRMADSEEVEDVENRMAGSEQDDDNSKMAEVVNRMAENEESHEESVMGEESSPIEIANRMAEDDESKDLEILQLEHRMMENNDESKNKEFGELDLHKGLANQEKPTIHKEFGELDIPDEHIESFEHTEDSEIIEPAHTFLKVKGVDDSLLSEVIT